MVEDADSEMIVQATATPGNVPDGSMLPELIDAHPREPTADKAYDSKANYAYLASQGVSSGIMRRHKRPAVLAIPGKSGRKSKGNSLNGRVFMGSGKLVTGV